VRPAGTPTGQASTEEDSQNDSRFTALPVRHSRGQAHPQSTQPQEGNQGMGRRLQKDAWIVNYYPFHIGDYLSATRHLSWEEDAAYRRLLDTYYTTEKPIPNDLRAACRLVLATTETQREAVRVVLDEFFSLTESGWINERADREIDAMREKQEKQRAKANKRWHKPVGEHGIAPVMPQHENSCSVAQENRADAMPPTPTPTPTPTEEKEKHTRFAPLVFLKAHGVDEKLAGDWLTLRRAKKLPATETAIQGIESEAAKAGMDLSKAITECCHRGWGGFKAEWMKISQEQQQSNPFAGAV